MLCLYVISLLRLLIIPTPETLREWIQAFGATICGIVWVDTLQVVPHFSSGIVERAKRERA